MNIIYINTQTTSRGSCPAGKTFHDNYPELLNKYVGIVIILMIICIFKDSQ